MPSRSSNAPVPPPGWSLFPALRHARLDRREIAGSLGDLGTFLPLLVALSSRNGLDFATGLFFAGLFNASTGLLFPIPMAVQPMKAIAAIALSAGLSAPQIVAAGASVSAVLLVMGATGLIDPLTRIVPASVIRGIQLAVGLTLIAKGVQMVVDTKSFVSLDGYATAAAAVMIVLALAASRRVPAALVLFAAGCSIAFWTRRGTAHAMVPALWHPSLMRLTARDFEVGFLKAGLPQIPLTTLNSVIAVCALSADLFPDRPARPRRVATSVGLMNLIGCAFGAMPMCHGAGGLAGQYRFGARTNGSILLLGASKMALALVFGSALIGVTKAFPGSILGVMLAFSGAELGLVVRDQTRLFDAFVAVATAGIALAVNDVAVGALVGLVLAISDRFGLVREPREAPDA